LAAFDTYFARSKRFEGHRYRALLHARAGRAQEARRDLAAFATFAPDPVEVEATTALVDVFLGEMERGLEAMDRAVRANAANFHTPYLAAGVYARASAIVRTRQVLWAAGLAAAPRSWMPVVVQGPPRPGQAEQYADRAVALLRQAVAGGFRNAALLY